MKDVARALWVIEKTHQIGRIEGSMLAQFPGWDRVKAFRYLKTLAELGWLERVSPDRAVYVLGPKVLALAPDWGKGL